MAGTIETALTSQRWVRSNDGTIAGVCAGLGRRFNVEPWILRALWLVAALVFGTGVLLYLILWATLPREDELAKGDRKRLLGVCARMSRASGVDIGVIRALTVILGFASFGATVVGYLVLHFIMPEPAVQQHLTAAPTTITVR